MSWTRLVLIGALILLGAAVLCGCRGGRPDGAPDYSVRNRLPGAGGDTADVLVPSLSRGDEHREEICRGIAAAEGLAAAFFFSTEAALSAHQAHLPSPEQLNALQMGFLGELRDGVFTGGETIYPGAKARP